jgi:hypothetical protein
MATSSTGNTIFDFLIKLIRDLGYIVILPAAVVLFAGVWGLAHWNAQPCERVSVWWGMVDYSKGGDCPPAVAATSPTRPVSTPLPESMPITLRHGASHSLSTLTITALFNQVGGESFATLRLTPDNAATVNKAVLGGETFTIPTSTGKLLVSVLSLNSAEQTVTLKLNPAR